MAKSARFRGPASDVDLQRLLNRGLRLTGICVGVAMLIHGALLLRSFDTQREEGSRPLTSRFVQRQPRLTKPMELRKKPKPRQRKMVRQEVKLQARVSRLMTSQTGRISLRSLRTPPVALRLGG